MAEQDIPEQSNSTRKDWLAVVAIVERICFTPPLLETRGGLKHMTTVDLFKIQQEAGYYLKCVICSELIHPERLKRGADTCTPDHQREKRKAQRRFLKLLTNARLMSSPSTLRRLLSEGRSAPQASEVTV